MIFLATENGLWWHVNSIRIGVNVVGYPVCSFKKGADTRTFGRFHVAVVQSVLLLGSSLLVVTINILRLLGSLHNWVAQRITGRIPWYRNDFWE